MDTLEFSGPPEEYVLNEGMYHCLSCVPRVDVKADGGEQKVTGQLHFDTISVRVVDPNSVEFAFKKEGKLLFACTETVSPNGTTMTEEFTETPASQRVTGHALFKRVAAGSGWFPCALGIMGNADSKKCLQHRPHHYLPDHKGWIENLNWFPTF